MWDQGWGNCQLYGAWAGFQRKVIGPEIERWGGGDQEETFHQRRGGVKANIVHGPGGSKVSLTAV